jgi:hypothetical protein
MSFYLQSFVDCTRILTHLYRLGGIDPPIFPWPTERHWSCQIVLKKNIPYSFHCTGIKVNKEIQATQVEVCAGPDLEFWRP